MNIDEMINDQMKLRELKWLLEHSVGMTFSFSIVDKDNSHLMSADGKIVHYSLGIDSLLFIIKEQRALSVPR